MCYSPCSRSYECKKTKLGTILRWMKRNTAHTQAFLLLLETQIGTILENYSNAEMLGNDEGQGWEEKLGFEKGGSTGKEVVEGTLQLLEGGEEEENGDSEEEGEGKAREKTGKRKEGRSRHSDQRHFKNQEDEEETTEIHSKARHELILGEKECSRVRVGC